MENKIILIILADVVGWGYFLCWTVSFLPQIYENWRRKCVVGFSFDMLAYFLLSYITYLIYNVTVFFDPGLVFDNSGEDNPVKTTDVVFAIVAFICTSYQGIQCLMYDRGSQKIHSSTIVVCVGCLVALFILVVLKCFGIGSWFLVLQYCGYVKLVVSFGTVSLFCFVFVFCFFFFCFNLSSLMSNQFGHNIRRVTRVLHNNIVSIFKHLICNKIHYLSSC